VTIRTQHNKVFVIVASTAGNGDSVMHLQNLGNIEPTHLALRPSLEDAASVNIPCRALLFGYHLAQPPLRPDADFSRVNLKPVVLRHTRRRRDWRDGVATITRTRRPAPGACADTGLATGHSWRILGGHGEPVAMLTEQRIKKRTVKTLCFAVDSLLTVYPAQNRPFLPLCAFWRFT